MNVAHLVLALAASAQAGALMVIIAVNRIDGRPVSKMAVLLALLCATAAANAAWVYRQ